MLVSTKTGLSQRQQLILEFIRDHGSVQVDELSAHLNVTPQTIRRDLNQLYNLDLLHRVHGGAVLKDSIENLGYGARCKLMTMEKSYIARRAAELIPDNSSLFINIGTTNERVAEYLYKRRGLLVITNNINVAKTLWPAPGIEVMITGGTVRQADGGIVGSMTEEFISKFKVDRAVIGCSAIDLEGIVYDFDIREVRVAQAIIENSRSTMLVTDSMKFERRAPVRIADFSLIDTLVTDEGIPQDGIRLCRDKDVKLEAVPLTESRTSEAGVSDDD